MIPRHEFDPSSDLPPCARYWLPRADQVDYEGGEGIGFFQDVRLIINIPLDEAQQVATDERAIARIVDELSPDGPTFELLASLVEYYNPDDVDTSDITPAELERLEPYLDEWSPLEGLELGVSGLSHVLASIGCVPAASCRSHVTPHSWSDRPVVYVATDEPHARWLQPFVRGSGCGFDLNPERPDFLVIEAPSIHEMVGLTGAILEEATARWPSTLARTFQPAPAEVDGSTSSGSRMDTRSR